MTCGEGVTQSGDTYEGPDISQGPDKTALNDAITAAETLYNSIKDNTDYADIASTLQTAINNAKAVAESSEAGQNDVDVAASAIGTAKTTAEAGIKDVDDTKAANAVITKINALPASTAVTTENREAIEAARADYDALTDDQKAKVSADTLKKLTDAEEKLVVLQVMSEVSTKNGSGMTYTGNPIQLINTPTTSLPDGYTMKYAVTTENTAPANNLYTTSIPSGTDAGT